MRVRSRSFWRFLLGDGTGCSPGSGEGEAAAMVVWEVANGVCVPLGELDMTLSDIMEVDILQGDEGGGILKNISIKQSSNVITGIAVVMINKFLL